MTATLTRMERDGLVSRRPNPEDGRSTLVALTPLALGKLPAVAEATATINALVLEETSSMPAKLRDVRRTDWCTTQSVQR